MKKAKLKSGMDALGFPVPSNRVQKTYNLITETIAPNMDKDLARRIVGRCAELVKRDEPSGIISDNVAHPVNQIDVTSRYMVLASLLSD